MPPALLKGGLATCRSRGIACDVVDPATVTDRELGTYRYVVVPRGTYRELAARAGRAHALVVTAVEDARGLAMLPGVTTLRGPHGTFFVVENWSDHAVRYEARDLPHTGPAPRAVRAEAA